MLCRYCDDRDCDEFLYQAIKRSGKWSLCLGATLLCKSLIREARTIAENRQIREPLRSLASLNAKKPNTIVRPYTSNLVCLAAGCCTSSLNMRKTSLRPPRVFRLVFLGTSFAGKTSIIEQMVYGIFEPGKVWNNDLCNAITNNYSDEKLLMIFAIFIIDLNKDGRC